MSVIFRTLMVILLLINVNGCGNGKGDSKTLLNIVKLEPKNSSILLGKELNISLDINSTRELNNTLILFSAFSYKDENKSIIERKFKLDSSLIDIKSGINNYNIQVIIPTDTNDIGEYYISAQIDPLNKLNDIVSKENLYLSSEDRVEIISNSQPDVKLLNIYIDNNIQDSEISSMIVNDINISDLNKTYFLDYGIFKTFSNDNLIAINDKNLTISGILSVLPLVKDMNHTEITACMKIEEDCIPLKFKSGNDKKEVNLSINHSMNIAFELFIDADTLNIIAKKLFKMKIGEALNVDIQFKLENSDYGFEREFISPLAIQTNRLLENYIDTKYDPIYIASQYYSNPIVMGDEENTSEELNDIIVLSTEDISNDYTEDSSNQKVKFNKIQKLSSCTYSDKDRYTLSFEERAIIDGLKKNRSLTIHYVGIDRVEEVEEKYKKYKECVSYLADNSKSFEKIDKREFKGEYFGSNFSFHGKTSLDYHGIKAKVSGDISLNILKHRANIFNVDFIAKSDPISFKETGYNMTIKAFNKNIYSNHNDLYKETGLSNSGATDLKKKIKGNLDRINQRYSRDEQHSLISFKPEDDAISFGLSDLSGKIGDKLQFTYYIPLGPFDIEVTAGIDPEFGIKPSIDLDGISGITANVTPYAKINSTASISGGVIEVARAGIEGEVSLIEYDFVMGASGKLDFVNKNNSVHQFKGKITEEISHKLKGPNGRIYLFVEYPVCVEREPDGFLESLSHAFMEYTVAGQTINLIRTQAGLEKCNHIETKRDEKYLSDFDSGDIKSRKSLLKKDLSTPFTVNIP